MQLVRLTHDTEERPLAVAPVGLGVVWMDQAVPFHTSANVTATPEPLAWRPTASQLVGLTHDTPDSKLVSAPGGLGVTCTPQAAPFHTSANVTATPELSVE